MQIDMLISCIEQEMKKSYVLNQLLDKNILTTTSGKSIFELSYQELVRELALYKIKNN